MLDKIILYFLKHRFITIMLMIILIVWGIMVSPFYGENQNTTLKRVSVDALPDIGENQQIVFTEWAGHSPQDIEDQITNPLTSTLLGISGVKAIRSSSFFGFSSIYVIFSDDKEYYWTRTRILEKLNALPNDLLPENIHPTLGPDATALGQIFWYTLEGRDDQGNTTGGWSLHEIRGIQDFYVKYGLSAVQGVSEVASIGGFVQEYQVDVDPDLLKIYDVSIEQVIIAVKNTNRDVGAKTMEINKIEYLIRGLGNLTSISDLEYAIVKNKGKVPLRIKDIAKVTLGPDIRRGILDKEGAEVVGGVIICRFGANPMEVIEAIKKKISTLEQGMPKKILENGIESTLTIVPFYDRTELIKETLKTLWDALNLEILITIIIVLIMLFNLRASLIIAAILPISILFVFILMRLFNVEANIVALSGIAIAIGTVIDLGIILSENIVRHLKQNGSSLFEKIRRATQEVSGAILTAVSTTIISFIPIFALEAAEGKLFRPLAYTKTFALITALLLTLLLIPTVAYFLFGIKVKKKKVNLIFNTLIIVTGTVLLWELPWVGIFMIAMGLSWFLKAYGSWNNRWINNLPTGILILTSIGLLASQWMPLGINEALLLNILFIILILGVILGLLGLITLKYKYILTWCLIYKKTFLSIPVLLIFLALFIWLGFEKVAYPLTRAMEMIGFKPHQYKMMIGLKKQFPGLNSEFMPSLNEGSFLLMPSAMSHIGIEENKKILQTIDRRVANIPEISSVVGKLGRVNSALDPAPISMYENTINYKPEYYKNDQGNLVKFKTDKSQRFILKSGESYTNDELLNKAIGVDNLIIDPKGNYFRNWRSRINSSDDIWKEIILASKVLGVTSAPKLQPIETRLIMLQSGMRSPIGIKIFGSDLQSINDFSFQLEPLIRQAKSVNPETVFADNIIGKPYIMIHLKRKVIAKYGLSIESVQQHIETAIGGVKVGTSVSGKKRYPIRVRYPRERRDHPEALTNIYVDTPTSGQVRLGDLVTIDYERGPQVIKSEDAFLLGYLLLDKYPEYDFKEVIEELNEIIEKNIEKGSLIVPNGVHYEFDGNFKHQIRAEKRLMIIVPLVLLIIFIILYMQFKTITTSLMIFFGIIMAFSGGFILMGLYQTDWFLNFSLFGTQMREVFQIQPINLSVAVWVGFIALFGIATDDGVLMGTYLNQIFQKKKPDTIIQIRKATLEAGLRRIRPAVMTTATTLIALLPILTSSGRGSDIMIPMAIPIFGGMVIASVTYFIVPVLYSWQKEIKLKNRKS